MARRPNYGFEKRQREIKKQKKREAKAERKRLKKEAAQAELGDVEAGSDEDRGLADDALDADAPNDVADADAPDDVADADVPVARRGFFDT